MAKITKIDNQLLTNGSFLLDAKLQPVNFFENLNDGLVGGVSDNRVLGMTRMVLNPKYHYDEDEEENVIDGINPESYIYIGGKEKKWIKSNAGFQLETDKVNDKIYLSYNGEKLGEGADLSDILQDWQYDLHIVSGTTIEEDGKTYLELYTNDLDGDGPDETVRIDVSNLGGGKNYTNITVEGSDIEE